MEDRTQSGTDDWLKQQIDENLRRVYAQALEEKVPDHLLALLERLQKKDGGA